jgi:hypothetical protein
MISKCVLACTAGNTSNRETQVRPQTPQQEQPPLSRGPLGGMVLGARAQQPRSCVGSGSQLAHLAHPWGQIGLQETRAVLVDRVCPLMLVIPRVKQLPLRQVRGNRTADPQKGPESADMSGAGGPQGGQSGEEGRLDLARGQTTGGCST